MSQALSGNYYIVNSVANSADGSRLAINFNGQGQPLTVSPLVTSNVAQVVRPSFDLEVHGRDTDCRVQWTFSGSKPSTQSISPQSASGLQIAFGSSNTLTALPASSYIWDVTPDGTGNYTFVSFRFCLVFVH